MPTQVPAIKTPTHRGRYLLVGVADSLARRLWRRGCGETMTARLRYASLAYLFSNQRGSTSCPIHKTKNHPSGGFMFWWEWLDSNQLRLKPTDLQSAPALQLRRTPNLGAGSGNRTRISSLEGLHTSLCTMPATNRKRV